MVGSAVDVRAITKSYGQTRALSGVTLDIAPGEFMTLVGPSGCGKSTLLRIVAGLEPQTSGEIAIGGRSIDGLPPKERDLAMVFQNYALYPHLTARDNIAAPLVMRRLSFLQRFPALGRLMPGVKAAHTDIARSVERVARALEIDELLARRPAQLSGGQRQRVALARAMVRQPGVFLMDEPLSSLDARLRVHMRGELSDLHRELGATVLYVTHDQIEAMTMSGRIAVMMQGAIVQLGTPREVYGRPANLAVAQFFGTSPINVVAGHVDEDRRPVLLGATLPFRVGGEPGSPISVAARPEALVLEEPRDPVSRHGVVVQTRLERLDDYGADLLLHLRPEGNAGGAKLTVRIPAERFSFFERGRGRDETLRVALPLGALHIFDGNGARLEIDAAAVSLARAAP